MKNVLTVGCVALVALSTNACGGSADGSESESAVSPTVPESQIGGSEEGSATRQDRLPLCDLLSCEDVANSCEESASNRRSNCDRCWRLCDDPYAPSTCSKTCSSICDGQIPHGECDARFDKCVSAARERGCRMPESACGEIRFDQRATPADHLVKVFKKVRESKKPECGMCDQKLGAVCDPLCKDAFDRYKACEATEGCSTTPYWNELNQCYFDALTNDPKCNQAFAECFDLLP